MSILSFAADVSGMVDNFNNDNIKDKVQNLLNGRKINKNNR